MVSKKKFPPRKPRVGRTPDILRKGGPMRDRTKYNRKQKRKAL